MRQSISEALVVSGGMLAVLLAACGDSNGGADASCDCDAYCFACDDPAAHEGCGEDAVHECACWDKWVASCFPASSEEECEAASAQLPGVNQCEGGDDGWHQCIWFSSVETSLNGESDCTYGEMNELCGYISGGEEGYGNTPPCEEWPDTTAFFYEQEGTTYTGWAGKFPLGVESLGMTACDAITPDPEICGCICETDYPI